MNSSNNKEERKKERRGWEGKKRKVEGEYDKMEEKNNNSRS